MKKLIIGLLVFALVLVMFPAAVYAKDFAGTDYSVDVQNDADYLYINFEATGGDYIAHPGMTNIYVLATGECWAYTAFGKDEIEGLSYSGGGLVGVKRTTSARVEASTLTMNWKIPLSETTIVPGDTIAFHFLSFSEGSSNWNTAWLYNQDYALWAPEPTEPGVIEEEEEVYVRTHDMTCYQVYVNDDGNFEFVFWWEYKNNNWVSIYDMEGNLVYIVDFPHGKPVVVVDLPDGMYTVQTFHEAGKVLQEFVIGK